MDSENEKELKEEKINKINFGQKINEWSRSLWFWQGLTLFFAGLFVLNLLGYRLQLSSIGGQANFVAVNNGVGSSSVTDSSNGPMGIAAGSAAGINNQIALDWAKENIPQDNADSGFSWNNQKILYSVEGENNGMTILSGLDKSITDLNEAQQAQVKKMTENIYHPCCDGYIAQCDCEHSVALRGLVKMMSKSGKSDEEITRAAFDWSKYFFPQHYANVAAYMMSQGQDPKNMNAGKDYGLASFGAQIGQALQTGQNVNSLPQQKGGC